MSRSALRSICGVWLSLVLFVLNLFAAVVLGWPWYTLLGVAASLGAIAMLIYDAIEDGPAWWRARR